MNNPSLNKWLSCAGEPLRIALVDDSDGFVQIIQDFVGRLNGKISIFDSAEKAIPILSGTEKIDLMLLDIRMPGIGGVELFRQIKEGLLGENRRALKIAVVSGFLFEGHHHDFSRFGFCPFIEKASICSFEGFSSLLSFCGIIGDPDSAFCPVVKHPA